MSAILIRHVNLLIVTFLIALSMMLTETSGQYSYLVSSTEFEIFRDGVVRIVQTLYVNETAPSISLTLFSRYAENILVLDQDSMPLSYELLNPPNMTIITLGVFKVTTDYLASDLTTKEGNLWTFKVYTPYNATISLPSQSSLTEQVDIFNS